jgi:hypothetical protein
MRTITGSLASIRAVRGALMHGLSIRTFTCNWVFTKTQYAAETPGAKVGGSVFVDLDAYQFSPNPFLDNSRVTDAQNVVFPPSKADPERTADFCNRQSAI